MKLSEEQLKKIRDLIAVKTGIYMDDNKLLNIYRKKIEEFVDRAKYKSFESFYSTLVFEKDKELLQDFISLITVNETYFFREKYQFEALIKNLLPELDKLRPKGESIKILSAPCSSGEELYSIAIYILEEEKIIEKRDIALIGIDIDKVMIEKAKRGVYTKRSISKIPSDLLRKYFDFNGTVYKIKNEISKNMTFEMANVLDFYSLKRLGSFDVIFSRNMLIYFDDKTRREVFASFYSILKPGGYLLLGHAEKVPEDMKLFKRIKLEDSIVYKKV
ncbi:CheR family methyltransferase [Nitrosophilus labii]|uniref:CheR family methyltransferase n=1 Tax=Nitrosophilus labii TaxID=2706014 RepID=UPI0016575D9A|nr:CheR family methyltransferase [Nitrosophilus labii]